MKTVVMGIGNLLLGDEGAGCRCVEELEKRYELPPEVECVDGGVCGYALLPIIEEAEALILIDALSDGREPGTVILAEDEAVPRKMGTHGSPHQIGICEVLALARIGGREPKRLLLFGIEPKVMELGIGLSPEGERGVEKALAEVVRSLGELGHEVTAKAGALGSE